jgi:uncharacterized surface protein with fasciclin (FAS1) repeats
MTSHTPTFTKTITGLAAGAMMAGSLAAMAPASAAPPAPEGLVGPACASYSAQVPSGPGSLAGMAMDPVAVAASNNPMLTTVSSAISGKLNPDVNLADTLNSGDYTVFAPTDAAFAKLDADTQAKLKTDGPALNNLLTYHIVPGKLTPSEVVGTHKTVEGQTITVSGTGTELKADDADVSCGGVPTANATVYMVDTVLMPPSSVPSAATPSTASAPSATTR